MDEQVRRGGQDFAQDLIAQRVIIDAVVKMLLAAIQDPIFLKDVQVLGTTLGKDIVTDQGVMQDVVKLLVKVFQDEEIQFEVGEMLKKVIQKPDVSKELVNLLSVTFQDPDAKDAITTLLNESFNKILLDPETIDKFRIFSYNLMKAEIQGKGKNKSSLFDLMVKKAVSRSSSEVVEKSEIEDLLLTGNMSDLEALNQLDIDTLIDEQVEKIDVSVVKTDAVEDSVRDLIKESSPLDEKQGSEIELSEVDASGLEIKSTSSNFSEEFVLLGGEISPNKSLIGEGVNLHDFELIDSKEVNVLDNEIGVDEISEIESLLSGEETINEK